MFTVRNGPLVGLVAQFALLAGIAATVGLGTAAWLAGAGYGLVTWAALSRSDAPTFGPADRVTLLRATLVGAVAALAVEAFVRREAMPVLVGLAGVALALDAVDGYVARRTGTATTRGARFDMEVDSSLLLLLAVYVTRPVGAWVLAIGLMRYALVAAAWLVTWLRGPMPARRWRKVVAAVQGIVLLVAAADVLPRPVTVVGLAVALALLAVSFGTEIAWRRRHRSPASPVPVS